MEENSGNREHSESHRTDGGQGGGVVFLGWQKMRSGEEIALYNVTAEDHPLYGSTVTDRTLREHDLSVPKVPAGNNGNNGKNGSSSGGRK
ncbi:MAG: hypothetical protein WEB33_11530 [Bacteroidota bacterium]